MISKKTKYALKALGALADQDRYADRPMLIIDLAKQERIPRKFLEVILLDLKNHGILRSKMGKGGGYFLAKPARRIQLGTVIRALEGALAPLPCLSRTHYEKCEECLDESHCRIRLLFKDVYEATLNILDNTSLQEMVDRTKHAQTVLTYDI